MHDALVGHGQLETLRERICAFLERWREPNPVFSYEVGWSTNYDHLLIEDFDAGTTSTDEIMAKALQSGRVLISGRAGAAKTTVLRRLLKSLCATADVLPILIDVKEWKAPFYDDWKTLPTDFSFRLSFLLQHMSEPKLSLTVLDAISPSVLRVFAIDGLNEVTPTLAQEIIRVADEYIRRSSQSVVILTDRVVRRTLNDASRWHLCAIKALTDGQVRQALEKSPEHLRAFEQAQPSQRELFRTPLFLDLLLHSNIKEAGLLTTETEIERYFQDRVGLETVELDSAARAAFIMYKSYQARSFPLEAFRNEAGQTVAQKISESSLRLEPDGTAYFWHHLHHDYLAARYVAHNPAEWSSAGFDALTFKAASFDAITLALEQIQSSEVADNFIRQLYDWNPYAPAYALADTRANVFVTDEMRLVMFATLAEKKWDLMLNTAQTARDALSIFPPDSMARRLLGMPSLSALLDEVRRLNITNPDYQQWQRIFCMTDTAGLPDAEFEKITSSDLVIGWTLANVLKRTRLSDKRQRILRSWLKRNWKSQSVVWRIAHILGAYPSAENIAALEAILDDHPEFWPRYGALRSMVEAAARAQDRDFRLRIFRELANRAQEICSGRLLPELRRSLFLVNAPSGWADDASILISTVFELRTDEDDQNSWKKFAQEFMLRYGSLQANASLENSSA